MKECISIKTDYSILTSMIKLPDLFSYAKKNNYSTLGIIDDNLSYVAEFNKLCQKYNIKGLIGLEIKYQEGYIYLYAKNNKGYNKLIKINTSIQNNQFNINMIDEDLLPIIPYEYYHLYNINNCYIGYKTEEEKQKAQELTNNTIYFNIVLGLDKQHTKYINYLNMIKDNLTYNNYNDKDYTNNVIWNKDLSYFTKQINLNITYQENLIPHYDNKITDSYNYLKALSYKGLSKRLNNNIPLEYKTRLDYELNTIKQMNYVDYFLIVYDYVKYAIKNNIYVGPGRGSAVGSLVTYSLGITSIDPLKYNLLFERFLNPGRITMPDIDIDFDATKRDQVIEYVKQKYGKENVMGVITYAAMTSKLALLTVSKILNTNISILNNYIDSKKTLKENLTKETINIINKNKDIKEVYYGAMMIEGIKKHISTNAAGIVISKKEIDNIIPIIKNGEEYLTGYTKDYLEDIGLLKMDFLSIKNLTIISETLKDIPETINLNNITIEDKKVYQTFSEAKTIGIFQFDTPSMKYLLKQIKPNNFNDLIVSLGLIRPGANKYIETFSKRKYNLEKTQYIDNTLEDILKETNGIIVYQEQIMEIFKKVASYTFSEADLIRRAISKKNETIILGEKDKFINRALTNGYTKETATLIFNNILKFAEYGFNKSHSVGYAFLAYQMMYLKVNYPQYFYKNLLNQSGRSQYKEIIDEAKQLNLTFTKPNINTSSTTFEIDKNIIMPLSTIKNISKNICEIINNNKPYTDYFDFISKIYGQVITKEVITTLIYAGALDTFNYNRKTLINNLDSACIYAELINGLETSLVNKPSMTIYEEYENITLMEKEYELYGYYISNHPSSKYNCPKSNNIHKYFDKNLTIYGFIKNIKTLKTKKGEDMAFINITDEYGTINCTLFPKKYNLITNLKNNDFIKVTGQVQKRQDKYQIIINNIEKENII